MRIIVIILVLGWLLCFPVKENAQTFVTGKGYIVPAIIVGVDTFPYIYLNEVIIVSKREFASYADQYRFNQLRQNIITVYPYAKKAGVLFKEIQENVLQDESRREHKKYIRSRSKELDDEFSEPLKSLTITQGKILVKLISRETGENVYDIIKEYKSGTRAFYWNTLGRFLGYDLKTDFDPQQDKDIEIIMRSLEGNTQL